MLYYNHRDGEPAPSKRKEKRAMDTKDWIGAALTAWANIIATLALIHTIRQDKKKTAKSPQHTKQKRKKR